MRRFDCVCGARVFFENVSCLSCNRELGFIPEIGQLSALTRETEGTYLAHAQPEGVYRKCHNYTANGLCNWMVPAREPSDLCQACSLNRVIPDLSLPENITHWSSVEAAKRRMIYTLNRLRLPIVPRSVDPEHGLAFDIKADTADSRVLTGHADGLVTLNLAEADPILRERMRVDMGERYRTLLGHFRHELGHYYWDLLIADGDRFDSFRVLFGDERRDYSDALRDYYERPPEQDTWVGDYVSSYARAHPWEDWAETWAHYLHMIDTLETAQSFGFGSAGEFSSYVLGHPFEQLVSAWFEVTVALNALNRSMGLPDAYPFQTGDLAKRKLRFVHEILTQPLSPPQNVGATG